MSPIELIVNLKIDLKRKIDNIAIKINSLSGPLKIQDKINKLSNLKIKMESNEFWFNHKKASLAQIEKIKLEKIINNFNVVNNGVLDCLELLKIINEEKELIEIKLEIDKYNNLIRNIEFENLLSGLNDYNNAILSINVGSGGVDSQDFAEMLLRMYKKYAEYQNYNIKLIDIQYGEEAGIKSATILISGDYAYGYLKSEIGVHRLVRISPFDSSSRRHTSFASVWALPEIADDIGIIIKSDDIRIDTFRSCGSGGQHVNKTDSAVRITHIKTNTVVVCQSERSQIKNRATAMKLLKSKLYGLEIKKKMIEKDKAEAEKMEASFGSQIRNYVLSPYRMIKDLRTGYQVNNVDNVLDGRIQPFIQSYLLYKQNINNF